MEIKKSQMTKVAMTIVETSMARLKGWGQGN